MKSMCLVLLRRLVVVLTAMAACGQLGTAEQIGFAGRVSATQEAACQCQCCNSAYRPPGMQEQGEQLMCSVIVQEQNSATCPEQCQPPKPGTGPLNYDRFCLTYCGPVDTTAPPGGICAELPEGEQGRDPAGMNGPAAITVPPELDTKKALDAQEALAPLTDNSMEAALKAAGSPATMSDEDPEAPEASDIQALGAKAVEDAASGTGASGTAASGTENDNRDALVAQARGNFATAAGLEARAAKTELRGTRTLANTTDALLPARSRRDYIETASAEIFASVKTAEKYKKRAVKAAERAKVELEEIEKAPQIAVATVASAAAGSFLAKIQAETAEEAKFELLPPESLTLNSQPAGNSGTGPDFVPIPR